MSLTTPNHRHLLPLSALAAVLALTACDPNQPTTSSVKHASSSGPDIPDDYRALYQSAPHCTGLDWATLAAVGKVETDHGRSPLPGVHSGTNSAGAAGPMQFIASTWRAVRRRHPDVGPDIYNPHAAITAAAYKICDDGANQGDTRKALYAYNHSSKYVNQVTDQAREYRQ